MTKNNNISSFFKNIQNGVNNIRTNTFISSNRNYKNINIIKTNLNKTIDDINKHTKGDNGVNISRFYSRVLNGESSEQEFESIIEKSSNSIIPSLINNKDIVDLYNNINIIKEFMPKISDALELKKDSVLGGDTFSKDYLRMESNSEVDNEHQVQSRFKEIKRIYNLNEFIDECYDEIAEKGEVFTYIVPYSKAFNKLLQKRNANNNIFTESINFNYKNSKEKKDSICNISISVDNNSNIIESAVENYCYINESTILDMKDDSILNESNKYTGFDDIKIDGFIDVNLVNKNKKDNNITIPGCILKKLIRENVLPLYIDDVCLGYYYIEFKSLSDIQNSIEKNKYTRINNISNINEKEQLLKKITKSLLKNIDAKFINNNQDLKKEIYTILNNGVNNIENIERINMTFLPTSDVIHMYFKKDKNHRGISDLEKCRVPATLYIAIMMTNTVGLITRSQDKRVYYVKTGVDTNISKAMLNAINQLQKSNYGARDILKINNFLNIFGQNNDVLIPVGSSGESPINPEVMQGQNIDMKEELLKQLEETAINAIVPFEFVDSSNSIDFATRLTMHNGKFFKSIIKRQAKVEHFCDIICTKLYNCEYNDNIKIKTSLPTPAFLNTNNIVEVLQNINELTNNLVDIEIGDNINNETYKRVLMKKIKKHYLSTYVDFDIIQKITDSAKIEAEIEREEEE